MKTEDSTSSYYQLVCDCQQKRLFIPLNSDHTGNLKDAYSTKSKHGRRQRGAGGPLDFQTWYK